MKYHVPENWRELRQNAHMRDLHELREEVNTLRGAIKYAQVTWPAVDYNRLKSALGE